MKNFCFFLLLCTISACSSNDDCSQEYGKEFQINLGEAVCFSDGNSFGVIEIRDEICCCLCNCLWEGELRISVEVWDESGNKRSLTFGSSTFDIKDKLFDGYAIKKIDYLYDGKADALPLCSGVYDPKKVELTFKISPV